jgi:DNA-3-methyladenine glycosylase
VTQIQDITTKSIIVETEAYRGPDDKGCHAYKNRKTDRTKVMFEEGGMAYVYISYGMHNMLNIVTGPENMAHAILIRAIQPIEGVEHMLQRRNTTKQNYILTGGPGKVCEALNINKSHNYVKFYMPRSEIKIYDDGVIVSEKNIISTPRVGMSIHVAEYSNCTWRFYIKDNKYVSRPLQLWYNW